LRMGSASNTKKGATGAVIPDASPTTVEMSLTSMQERSGFTHTIGRARTWELRLKAAMVIVVNFMVIWVGYMEMEYKMLECEMLRRCFKWVTVEIDWRCWTKNKGVTGSADA
jgi:hypothetical protein